MKKILGILLIVAMLCTGSALAIGSNYTVTAQTHVGNFGREPLTFTISGLTEEEAAGVTAEDFVITGDFINPANTVEGTDDVTAVEYKDGQLILTVAGFRYNPSNFVVTYTGTSNANLTFTKADVAEVTTAIADDFQDLKLNEMFYRLYVPADAEGPVPLVVWHHGGGSIGTGNEAQLVNLLGATPFIEKYGQVAVLAPQCQRYEDGTFQDWTALLEDIRTVITGLIEDGTVDANRIYGVGCSFGGHGVIMDAAYNRDLFCAINVQCPMINGTNIPELLSLTDMGVYLTTAEHDGTLPYVPFDKMLMEALMKTNENAHIYVFSDEEMAAYGIGNSEGLTEQQKGAEYHNSWVLSFNNEQGVMDWLWSQSK